jgi:hypothetical protein
MAGREDQITAAPQRAHGCQAVSSTESGDSSRWNVMPSWRDFIALIAVVSGDRL